LKVDFRCVAASNKNLEELVKQGSFRPDLYYRLHVVAIELPPLRNRREDIPMLVQHFVEKYAKAMNRAAAPRVSAESMDLILRYDWPGNIRELENAVERALVIGRGPELAPADFSFQLAKVAASPNGRSLDEIEKAHIQKIWTECGGNQSQTARILGIDRTTLHTKLKRYGLK
jgi:DNA-binding NtrC family response regulator